MANKHEIQRDFYKMKKKKEWIESLQLDNSNNGNNTISNSKDYVSVRFDDEIDSNGQDYYVRRDSRNWNPEGNDPDLEL